LVLISFTLLASTVESNNQSVLNELGYFVALRNEIILD